MQLPGVLQPIEIVEDHQLPVLVLENMDGIPLRNFLENKPLDLDSFFDFSLQLIDLLGIFHERKLIHKI